MTWQRRFKYIFCAVTFAAVCFCIAKWSAEHELRVNFLGGEKNGVTTASTKEPSSGRVHTVFEKFNRTSTYKIGIFSLINAKHVQQYRTAIQSVQCYAQLHGYDYVMVPDSYRWQNTCNHTNIFFRRHCIIAHSMKDYDYALIIDADVGIPSPKRAIEEFIDRRFDVLLYERFDSFEISTSSFLVRSSEAGISFLNRLADFEARTPGVSPANADNGAIHILLAELVKSNDKVKAILLKIWNSIRTWDDYEEMLACFWVLVGDQREFSGGIKVIMRGRAWIRDHFVTEGRWSPDTDFMFHMWKDRYIRHRKTLKMPSANIPGYRHQDWDNPFTDLLNVTECEDGKVTYSWDSKWIATPEEIQRRMALNDIESLNCVIRKIPNMIDRVLHAKKSELNETKGL